MGGNNGRFSLNDSETSLPKLNQKCLGEKDRKWHVKEVYKLMLTGSGRTVFPFPLLASLAGLIIKST